MDGIILIAVISIKMFLSIFEIHIGHGLFFAILANIFGSVFIITGRSISTKQLICK